MQTKIYTFGIQDQKGKWYYLTTKTQLDAIQLRQAYYQDLKNTEESARIVISKIDQSKFNLDTACFFELTIKAISFNTNQLIK